MILFCHFRKVIVEFIILIARAGCSPDIGRLSRDNFNIGQLFMLSETWHWQVLWTKAASAWSVAHAFSARGMLMLIIIIFGPQNNLILFSFLNCLNSLSSSLQVTFYALLAVFQTRCRLKTCLAHHNLMAYCRFWTWQLWLLFLLSQCIDLLSEHRCVITLMIRPTIRWPCVIRSDSDFAFNHSIERLVCNKIRFILSNV